MLDRLGGGDQASVKSRRFLELLDYLLAFGDDALDGLASLTSRRPAEQFEDLLKAFDLALRLVVMLKKACFASSDRAARAIFGRAFRICFSAK